MLEMKLVANDMAISMMSEMIINEDRRNETEKEIGKKSIEEIKQDCELNAAKRLIPRFRRKKINVIRQIIKNKKTEKYSIWMWITNRETTRKNLYKIIYCARLRDYIENQGFKEQKVTSGIDLEHVY